MPTTSVTPSRPRLQFGPRYRPFGWWDAASALTLFAIYLPLELGVETPDDPNWRGPTLFDRPLRNALVAESRQGLQTAHDVSDVLWWFSSAFPIADAVLTPLFGDRGNLHVAARLTAINLHAMALNGVVSRLGHVTVGRERPDVPPCNQDEEYSWGCNRGPNNSFPSGHTSAAMTGAGLTCAHHTELPLYGSLVADLAACLTVSATATTGAVLRIVADRHYATDVLAGAALGWVAGFALPKLLHYRFFSKRPVARSAGMPSPLVTPFVARRGFGVVASGVF